MKILERAIICVPARNEARRLPALLASLGQQIGSRMPGDPGRVTLVLVVANATDGSAETALAEAARFPRLDLHLMTETFPADRAHVGAARRLAMERGAALLAERGVHDPALLTTDADVVPARNWISANLGEIDAGADVVAGRVTLDPREEAENLHPDALMRTRRIEAYDKTLDHLASLVDPLPHDPWPRHSDVKSASLALRLDLYRTAGGVPEVATGEDRLLVEAAVRAGGRLRHSLRVKVVASARLKGRRLSGQAKRLRRLNAAAEAGEPLLVEAPERADERCQRRRLLRRAHARMEDAETLGEIARQVGLDAAALAEAAHGAPSADALAARFTPDELARPATEPIEAASARLTQRIDALTSSAGGTPMRAVAQRA